jgi:hypothetical protein
MTHVTVFLMQREHIAYTATTDAQRRFQIEDVRAGAYTAKYGQRCMFIFPNIRGMVIRAQGRHHVSRRDALPSGGP